MKERVKKEAGDSIRIPDYTRDAQQILLWVPNFLTVCYYFGERRDSHDKYAAAP